jgi:hypothetical protein
VTDTSILYAEGELKAEGANRTGTSLIYDNGLLIHFRPNAQLRNRSLKRRTAASTMHLSANKIAQGFEYMTRSVLVISSPSSSGSESLSVKLGNGALMRERTELRGQRLSG